MAAATPAGASAFERLAPFIQEYIWKNRWTELRDIQARATAAALDSEDHILLAAGTASGKTEAAFLPILTQLHEEEAGSVGALYIGPLKALINDQFLRLNDLCVEAGIAVTAWHGDVAAGRKHALLRRPAGILQITPEALEGLLLNRSTELMRLFGDLRWVVIDEVHAFMASDRGGQVLSLLDRLARYALDRNRLPRRIGLSATLGDYGAASEWLAGATGRSVQVIDEKSARTVFLLVEHFAVAAPDDDEEVIDRPLSGNPPPDETALADRLIGRSQDLFDTTLDATQGRKSLIFTNRRGDAEEIVIGLRRLAERRGYPDIYHVHHGSIAAPLREAAEAAMREADAPACTAATVTLELGIDLGQLDRVLQLGPTYSVASFLQRLGRAGRRGQRPEMFFLLREESAGASASVLERMPWELLQTIALIQLYAEHRWIEPLVRPKLPGSLLYQQTMSVLAAAGELAPAALAERVLTLAPFRDVSQDEFRAFLRHLLEIDHLERTEEGGLILGLTGEKVVRSYRFLATFVDSTEWAVKEQARDIGTIGSPVPVGERFALAGRTWEVIDLAADQRVISVKRVRGSMKARFSGGGVGDIHDRIVERMRLALEESVVYTYMGERAVERLREARELAAMTGVARAPQVVPLGGDRFALLPWCGTRKLRTMGLRLKYAEGLASVSEQQFYIEVVSSLKPDELLGRLREMARESWSAADIVRPLPRYVCERGKYDPFLPDDLLKRSFAEDYLDVSGAAARFGEALLTER